MTRVRLALAGAGLVGKRHAESIDQLKHVSVSAIADPSADGRRFAESINVPWFASLHELLQHDKPDGVILATPTPDHVEAGLHCIDQRIPVLIEKPLSTSAAEAIRLVDAADSSGVPVLVGHHRRHNPLIRKARELIDAGEIGEVRAVQATCWFYKPDHYFEIAPWRTRVGAGPISVNLVHDVDLIRYLCGEIASVQAQTVPSSRGFENEELASALITFEHSAVGTISVADSVVAPWSWELTSGEYPIYPKTSESCYLIGGTHGALSIPDLSIWRHQAGRDWWSPISATRVPCESSDPLVNQMRHFAAVVKGQEAPLVSAMEGLRALRVIESIQQAASSSKVINIKDLAKTSQEISTQKIQVS